MAAKMTKQHSPEMIKAQLNGVSEEQYIKEVQKIVAENINDLFYKSNLTMRQFAVQVGISHSSLARILERSGENVRLDTICKIGANIGVSIQDIIISKHQLDAENINDLFYKSNLTMRQFAVQVGISHSSLARILERSGENVRLDTICKIGANIGVSIQDIIISKHQLDANQRKAVEDDIKQLTMHQQQKKQKAYKKKKKYTNPAGQINIFDYLQKIEESEKDKQK